jgi:hypothetical protein
MKFVKLFAGVAALLIAPMAAQAQTAAPAPTDQVGPAAAPAATPADPALAPAPAADPAAAPAAAPAATSIADGVTKEGGKYMKEGRKATKAEIAEYKKAEKARHE